MIWKPAPGRNGKALARQSEGPGFDPRLLHDFCFFYVFLITCTLFFVSLYVFRLFCDEITWLCPLFRKVKVMVVDVVVFFL